MAECDQSRGDYPTGGKMGKAFCLFDKLDLFANSDKMKVDWGKVMPLSGLTRTFRINARTPIMILMADFGTALVTGFSARTLITGLWTRLWPITTTAWPLN